MTTLRCCFVAVCLSGLTACTLPPPEVPTARVTASPLFSPRVYDRIAIYVQNVGSGVFVSDGALRQIEDEFIHAALAKGYTVAARSDFERVIRDELRLQASAITEQELARVGRILNVRGVLLVTVNELTSRYEYIGPNVGSRHHLTAQLGARLIEVERAQVVWVAGHSGRMTVPDDRMREAVLPRVANTIATALPDRNSP